MTEPDAAEGNLTRQTVDGLRWSMTATLAGVVIQLVYTAVVGRMLEPRVFGLVASAQVVLTFGSYFAEMGLGQALIQKATLTEEEIRASFTSSVILGAVSTGVILAAAPLMATVFDSPDVVPVAQALGCSLLVTALGLTSQNLLRRQLRFKAIAVIQMVATVVAYPLVGIGLAIAGAGVWALVGAFLANSVVASLGAMVVARHGYKPVLALRRLRRLYAFGGQVSLISVLEYLGEAVVVVIVGRYAGQGPLGQFNRAFLLIHLPLYHLNVQLSNVFFPAISRVQDEIVRVRRAYLEAMQVIAGIVVPVTAGMAAAAPELVGVMLGPQWDTAADLLPLIAIAGAAATLVTFGGITAEALDALPKKMLIQAGYLVLLVIGLLAVPTGSLVGYAAVVAGAEVLRLIAYGVFMHRLLDMHGAQQLRVYGPALLAAGAVWLGIWGATAGARALSLPVGIVLLGQITTGALVLGVMATHGPLRPTRVELRTRVGLAFEGDEPQGASALVMRVLSIGDRKK